MHAGSGTPYFVSAPGLRLRGQPDVGSLGHANADTAIEWTVLFSPPMIARSLVDRVVKGGLLHESQREDLQALVDDRRRAGRIGTGITRIVRLDPARGKRAERVVVVLQGEAELLEVVGALGAASGLAGGLHSGKEDCDQERNYRNGDEDLDERETNSCFFQEMASHWLSHLE